MNYLQRRKILRKVSALDLIPVCYRGYDVEEERVVVLIPKFKSTFYHRIFPMTQKLFYRIKLDELGSAVWQTIDGKKNVRTIAREISENSQIPADKLADMEDRVNKFMTMLYERRFISFQQIMAGGEDEL